MSQPPKEPKTLAEARNSSRWSNTKRTYKKLHPPDEHGNYPCGLCPHPITPSQQRHGQLSFDHIIEASKDLTLFFALSNLQYAHKRCNQEKDRRRHQPKIADLVPANVRNDLKRRASLNQGPKT